MKFLTAPSSRLYEKSDAQLGMTPATYRRGGRGMNISYTIAPCSLGRVLVAATRARHLRRISGRTRLRSRRGIAQGISPRGNPKRLGGALEVGSRDCAASGRRESSVGFAHGRGGHRVPAARLGSVAVHPAGRDANVLRGRALHRPAQRDPRRGPRLRDKSGGDCGSLPPRGAHRRNAGRLPLGTRAQAILARSGAPYRKTPALEPPPGQA